MQSLQKGIQSLILRDSVAGEYVGGSWSTVSNEESRKACEKCMPHLNEGTNMGFHQQPVERKEFFEKLGPNKSSQVIFNDILENEPQGKNCNMSLDSLEP